MELDEDVLDALDDFVLVVVAPPAAVVDKALDNEGSWNIELYAPFKPAKKKRKKNMDIRTKYN